MSSLPLPPNAASTVCTSTREVVSSHEIVTDPSPQSRSSTPFAFAAATTSAAVFPTGRTCTVSKIDSAAVQGRYIAHLYFLIAGIALLAIVILLVASRRSREGGEEPKNE